MDGFAHKRCLQMAWSSEMGFSKEIVLSILSVVKQLTKLDTWTLGANRVSIHLGQIECFMLEFLGDVCLSRLYITQNMTQKYK